MSIWAYSKTFDVKYQLPFVIRPFHLWGFERTYSAVKYLILLKFIHCKYSFHLVRYWMHTGIQLLVEWHVHGYPYTDTNQLKSWHRVSTTKIHYRQWCCSICCTTHRWLNALQGDFRQVKQIGFSAEHFKRTTNNLSEWIALKCQKIAPPHVKKINRYAWHSIIVCWVLAADQAIRETANIYQNHAMIIMLSLPAEIRWVHSYDYSKVKPHLFIHYRWIST